MAVMNPPPLPPSAAPEPAPVIVHIGRNGEVIGRWPAPEARALLLAGTIRADDYFWIKGEKEWIRVMPPVPNAEPPYPFCGDDGRPLWFIKDGFVYGPRMSEELDALLGSGWLTEDTLVATMGMERWVPLRELLESSESSGSLLSEAGGIFLNVMRLKLQGMSTLGAAAYHLLSGHDAKK